MEVLQVVDPVVCDGNFFVQNGGMLFEHIYPVYHLIVLLYLFFKLRNPIVCQLVCR